MEHGNVRETGVLVRVFMVLLLCDQGAWELVELILWDHGEGTSVAHDEIAE